MNLYFIHAPRTVTYLVDENVFISVVSVNEAISIADIKPFDLTCHSCCQNLSLNLFVLKIFVYFDNYSKLLSIVFTITFYNHDNQILCTGNLSPTDAQSEADKISESEATNPKTFLLTLLMSFLAVSFVTNGIELKTDLFF